MPCGCNQKANVQIGGSCGTPPKTFQKANFLAIEFIFGGIKSIILYSQHKTRLNLYQFHLITMIIEQYHNKQNKIKLT